MSPKDEKRLTVAVSIERARQAFADPKEREVWMIPPGDDPTQRDEPAEGEDAPYPLDEVKIGKVKPNRPPQWSELRRGAADPPGAVAVHVPVTSEEGHAEGGQE